MVLYQRHGKETKNYRKLAAQPLPGQRNDNSRAAPGSLQTDFDVVLSLIAAAQAQAFVAVNNALIDPLFGNGVFNALIAGLLPEFEVLASSLYHSVRKSATS